MSAPITWSKTKRIQEALSYLIHKIQAKEEIKVQDQKPKLINSLVVMDQKLHTLN